MKNLFLVQVNDGEPQPMFRTDEDRVTIDFKVTDEHPRPTVSFDMPDGNKVVLILERQEVADGK